MTANLTVLAFVLGPVFLAAAPVGLHVRHERSNRRTEARDRRYAFGPHDNRNAAEVLRAPEYAPEVAA